MPYIRKRGRQLALVHGLRAPSTGRVDQRVLFVFFSRGEVNEALGSESEGIDSSFQSLLEGQYPQVRFDWSKIRRQLESSKDILPPEYIAHETDRRKAFRADLSAMVKRLAMTHPVESPEAAALIREHWIELEYLANRIQHAIKVAQDPKLTHWGEGPSRWRYSELANAVPPDMQEHAAGFFERGEFDRAEAIFRLLVESFDRYAEGYNFLGLIALKRGRLNEAIAWFEKTVQVGRNLFPKRLGRSGYWVRLETRPYMRGLSNLAFALNAAGRYKEALAVSERLEGECGDKIQAASNRAVIFLNSGAWKESLAEAENLEELHGSECFVGAYACSELKRWGDALFHFLHGALNHPHAAPLLADRAPGKPADHDEQKDQELARNLKRSLKGYFTRQSSVSRGFFMKVVSSPKVRALLGEIRDVKARWHEGHRSGERKYYARMQEMQSPEFARARAAEMEGLLPSAD